MADTTAQLLVEAWIRDKHLASRFGQEFTKKKLALAWGATFEFDAVSTDGSIVAVISTSKYKTGGGKHGTGKCHKVLVDLGYLFNTACTTRIAIFSEECMCKWFKLQQSKGRVAPNVEILCVGIPNDLRAELESAREKATREVSPSRNAQ